MWAKFDQHPTLRELLLDTKEAMIVEHTANDKFWADGGDGSGANMLGKILAETREKLAQKYNRNLFGRRGEVIKFYEKNARYYEFANFWEAPIQIDGKTWPMTEVYFQAQKGAKTNICYSIAKLPTTQEVIDLEQSLLGDASKSDGYHFQFMEALRLGYKIISKQHPPIADDLIKTNNAFLIYLHDDDILGSGVHVPLGQLGANAVGVSLIEFRDLLRREKKI